MRTPTKTIAGRRARRSAARARLLPILALGILAAPAWAQRPVVTARLSQGILKLGGETQLEIEVEGTENASVTELPEVSGLTIGPLRGPSRQFYRSWVNGRQQSSTRVTWVAPVRPFAAGEFDLPPVVLSVDGRRVETRPLKLTVVEDLRGAELGHFTIESSSNYVVEGQPFSLELEFGFDLGLARKINYANLSLPWWGALPGTVAVESSFRPPDDARTEIYVNSTDKVIVEQLPQQEIRGRPFLVLRLRQAYVATRTGELDFSGSIFEFARAVDRGFFGTRAQKVESYYVTAPPLAVEVVPLPADGRPFDFGGAIGDIQARAETSTRDVLAGDSIKLTVEWTGHGNFEFFDVPDPGLSEAFNGFRVYGSTEKSKGFDHRSVVYDLAPLSAEVERIPPLVLPFYDPEEGRYRSAETPSIPIRVRPLADAVLLGEGGDAERFEDDVRDIHTELEAGAEKGWPRPGRVAVGATLAGVPLAWLLLRSAVRRRRGDPGAPLERRRRSARRRLARELRKARTVEEELEALQSFLAARTREPDQAWVGRDAAAHLEELNGETDLTWADRRALAEALADLEGAAYGGRQRRSGKSEILSLADRLLGGGL